MAQIDFSKLNANTNNSFGRGDEPQFKYFSLRNDGDEAIVRIMYDSTADFDLLTIHPTEIDGRKKSINCLRDAHDPMEKCPFCANNRALKKRIFVRLLEYTREPDGSIKVEPKIWERPATLANTLANLISEYGPLSDSIFKIKRSGVAGSTETTYNFMYGPPQIYKPEIYPKKTELFEGFKVLGRFALDKSAEDMNYFIQNGVFPQKAPQQPQAPTNPQPAPKVEAPQWNNAPTPTRTFSPQTQNTGVKPGPRYY